LGVIFSGYTTVDEKPNSNYILTKPSPRVRVKVSGISDEIDYILTNRHELSDFMLIDLNKNDILFDEELSLFEMSEYVYKCWKSENIPFLNQFFDIHDSWKYFTIRDEIKRVRQFNIDITNKDKNRIHNIIGDGWKIENNIDNVLDFIVDNLKRK
jgi:hypothetical protein